MKCPGCGIEIEDNSKYCKKCGFCIKVPKGFPEKSSCTEQKYKPEYEYKAMNCSLMWDADKISEWFNDLAKEGWEPMWPSPISATLYFF